MAYIRGTNYIWSDGDRVHFWAADGFDRWQGSVWFERIQSEAPKRDDEPEPSGVALSQDVGDRYVVMRFAELVQQHRVREIVEHALSARAENTGCVALGGLAAQLLRAVEDLAPPDEHQ